MVPDDHPTALLQLTRSLHEAARGLCKLADWRACLRAEQVQICRGCLLGAGSHALATDCSELDAVAARREPGGSLLLEPVLV